MTTTLPANGFAKLLATENISVMYDGSATTATFDTESRVLRMPMWKDMSRRLNDMLIGHEVGHALFTKMSADDIVTFLKSVDSQHMDRVMQYLNVVEDARIDRLIQRKFPGLRKDYRAGYPEMMERGFFGPMDADLDSYSLVDRINLNYKTDMTVPFDVVEQEFIARIDDVEDLDEVLEIVRDVYEYAQVHDSETVTPDWDMDTGMPGDEEGEDQQESGQDQNDDTGGAEGADSSSDEGDDDNAGSGEGSDSEESDGQEEGGSSSNNAGDSAEDDSSEAKGEGTMESAADAEDDGSSAESEQVSVQSNGAGNDEAPRESQTQKAMQDALSNLTDDSYWSGHSGQTLPKTMDLDSIIVPFSEAKKDWDGYTLPTESTYVKGLRGSVTQLVQMFERKKRGAIFSKQQVAKTGTIDCTKLHTYKFNDDIFKRNTIVPNGKNHGIQMLIDWSGSMAGKPLSGCVSQVMLLSAFCKKAGIPFDCYAFTNNCETDRHDNEYTESRKVVGEMFNNGDKEEISGFRLIQITSSTLNKADFDLSMRILDMYREHGGNNYGVPHRWSLSGTPLHEALMAMRYRIPEFRAQYNLDVVTLTVLTDGQGYSSFRPGSQQTKVFDPITRRTLMYDKRISAEDCLVDAVRQLTGCNTMGFFAADSDSTATHMAARKNPTNFDTGEFKKIWRTERAYEIPQDGHDLYFLLKPEKVEVGNGLEDAVAGDLRSVRAQFKKAAKNATASRTLLNRITDVLAENLV